MSSEFISRPAVARRPRRIGAGMLLSLGLVLGLLALLGVGVARSQGGPLGVGALAPEFSLTTFDGDRIHSSDLRAHVVVINFWASWCRPCDQEAAALEQAWREFRERGVVFLGVDYVDTEAEARAYLERFGITYPNGPDLGTRLAQQFRIAGVPETFILDRAGRVAFVKIGPFRDLAEIQGAVEAVLGG